MSQLDLKPSTTDVSRLLAGAAETITKVRYCWLVTDAGNGGANARPMGRVAGAPDDDAWTIRFVTDGRSRKASELRHADKVSLIFQHDADDAYVALSGTATLREEASEVSRLWKRAYEVYFPTEQDRANAVFIEVEAEYMECWIRGVTPEPFGLRPTTLRRDAGGPWRLSD